MELNHLKYFYVVAREHGFTRASKVMRVQQPAISKMVKQLESELGFALLERDKKGVRLTKGGQEVFNRCEQIFALCEDIEAFSRVESTECHGPLRFGSSDVIASRLLPRLLSRYLKANPKVKPSIFTGTATAICDEIEEGRIEFGVFFTVPESDVFDFQQLGNVPFRLVVATAARKDPVVLSSFIGSREIDYPKTRSFPALEMLKAQRLNPEIRISSNNLDSHRQMVLDGLGVALLPAFMVDDDIRRKGLTVLYPEKKFSYSMKLATRKNKVLSRNAMTLISLLRTELK